MIRGFVDKETGKIFNQQLEDRLHPVSGGSDYEGVEIVDYH